MTRQFKSQDRMERKTAHNSTYPKGGFSYSEDTFVQAESLVLRMKFRTKNPALRVAAKRYLQRQDKTQQTKTQLRK